MVQSYSPGGANCTPIWYILPCINPSPHPKRHRLLETVPIGYSTMDRPLPSPSPSSSFIGGSGPLSNTSIHASLGPPASTTQTASRSVQQFLQGSRSWQTDRRTYHATPSVTIDRIYLRSTAMRPNNNCCFCVKLTVHRSTATVHRTDTDVKNYRSYLVDRVRCKIHKAVDQEAALFHQSEVQCPWNSTNSTEHCRHMELYTGWETVLSYSKSTTL